MTGTPTRDAPSGEQYEIGFGRERAVVTEVGATLRSYEVGTHQVIEGFDVGDICDGGRGQVLAPWPNRLADGIYEFEGVSCRVPLDEPERHNAIHGLVRWLPWSIVSRAQNVVVMACTLYPQPAYPWRLDLTVEYRLGREGLVVTALAKNPGPSPVPFGMGFHPYFAATGGRVDSMRLVIPASRRLVTDDRGLPSGEAATAGTEYDFVHGRVVGATALDTAFGELERDGEGVARIALEEVASGASTTLWMDSSFRYLMAFTGDTLTPSERRRAALALEPMTCPPNALQTGQDIARIAPGNTWRGRWGVTFRQG